MFGNRRNLLSDLSVIGTDLHSHLLPGIDDGAATLGDSLEMLEILKELGYRKVVTTPHVIASMYPNTKERILGQMYALREEVGHRGTGVQGHTGEGEKRRKGEEIVGARRAVPEPGVPIDIVASGEYHVDDRFMGLLEAGELIPFGAENYILIEFSFYRLPAGVEGLLERISGAGYTPILAHPERYPYLGMKFRQYEMLKEVGLLFQLNLNSLTGLYGWPIRLVAEKLIAAGMVEAVGSDAHHPGQVRELAKVLNNKHLAKLIDSGNLINHTF